MELRNTTSSVNHYQLATLASRIDPARCATDPEGAVAAAERLLKEAKMAIERAYQEERRKEFERKEAQAPPKNWVVALKEITGQKRKDRAVKCFLEFFEYYEPGKSKEQLDDFKRDKVTPAEMFGFQVLYMDWLNQPKHKKGKQGRRISERDGRVRIGRMRLLPIKSQKAA